MRLYMRLGSPLLRKLWLDRTRPPFEQFDQGQKKLFEVFGSATSTGETRAVSTESILEHRQGKVACVGTDSS